MKSAENCLPVRPWVNFAFGGQRDETQLSAVQRDDANKALLPIITLQNFTSASCYEILSFVFKSAEAVFLLQPQLLPGRPVAREMVKLARAEPNENACDPFHWIAGAEASNQPSGELFASLWFQKEDLTQTTYDD